MTEKPLYWLDREGRKVAHNDDFLSEPHTSWDLMPVWSAPALLKAIEERDK